MKICYEVQKDDYDSAGRVSSQIKKTLKQMGFGPQMIKRVAVSSYESEINLIIHSLGGTLCLEVDDEGIWILPCSRGIRPPVKKHANLALGRAWDWSI